MLNANFSQRGLFLNRRLTRDSAFRDTITFNIYAYILNFDFRLYTNYTLNTKFNDRDILGRGVFTFGILLFVYI